jgi:hypothetical protein
VVGSVTESFAAAVFPPKSVWEPGARGVWARALLQPAFPQCVRKRGQRSCCNSFPPPFAAQVCKAGSVLKPASGQVCKEAWPRVLLQRFSPTICSPSV